MYVAYFKIVCAMGEERRAKGSALFHINLTQTETDLHNPRDSLDSALGTDRKCHTAPVLKVKPFCRRMAIYRTIVNGFGRNFRIR